MTNRLQKKVRTPLKYSDLLDMLGDTEEHIYAALLAYYQSQKGRQDIDNSPHKGESAEAIVNDLMKEVRVLKGKA